MHLVNDRGDTPIHVGSTLFSRGRGTGVRIQEGDKYIWSTEG